MQSSPLWEQGHELTGHIIENWAGRYGGHDHTPGSAARLLTALTRLADTASIAAFLARLAEGGGFVKGDTGAMVEAASLLTPEQAATLIERIIRAKTSSSLEACAALLARAATRPINGRTSLAGAAEALLAALPGDPAQTESQHPWWNRPRPPSAGLVADVLIALGGVDKVLAMRAADHMLAWPKSYDLDMVLVPAVVDLVGTRSAKSQPAMGLPAVERLRAAALAHLRTRIAEPLEAPKDWRRNSQLPCSCPDCRDLARFLTALTRLADTESIAAFLDRLAEGGGFAKGDTGAMVEAAGLLAPEQAATLIERIIRAKASSSLEACAALLARAAATRPLSGRTSLAGAAEALLAALPGDLAQTDSQYPWWNRPRPPSAGLVADVLIALGRIDEALAMRAADHMLAWPKSYDLDVVLIPSVVGIVGTRSAKSLPPGGRQRATP